MLVGKQIRTKTPDEFLTGQMENFRFFRSALTYTECYALLQEFDFVDVEPVTDNSKLEQYFQDNPLPEKTSVVKDGTEFKATKIHIKTGLELIGSSYNAETDLQIKNYNSIVRRISSSMTPYEARNAAFDDFNAARGSVWETPNEIYYKTPFGPNPYPSTTDKFTHLWVTELYKSMISYVSFADNEIDEFKSYDGVMGATAQSRADGYGQGTPSFGTNPTCSICQGGAFVDLPGSLKIMNNFTITFWCYNTRNTSEANPNLYEAKDFKLQFNQPTADLRLIPVNGHFVQKNVSSIFYGAWKFFVITCDYEKLEVFMDNSSVLSVDLIKTGLALRGSSIYEHSLGRSNNSPQDMSHVLKYVRFRTFNEKLTIEQLKAIRNQDKIDLSI